MTKFDSGTAYLSDLIPESSLAESVTRCSGQM